MTPDQAVQQFQEEATRRTKHILTFISVQKSDEKTMIEQVSSVITAHAVLAAKAASFLNTMVCEVNEKVALEMNVKLAESYHRLLDETLKDGIRAREKVDLHAELDDIIREDL